jgi:hypothetical protein
MLIVPVSLRFGKVGPLFRLRWWIGNLCDEEGRRGFSNAVDEHPEQRNLEEYKEADSKSEENTLAIMEPNLFLLRSVADSRKVRLELVLMLAHVIEQIHVKCR